MFALVDCNSFYASCERLFRPDLKNQPIAVLSNNDGCIIALCDRAKALGVPMGAPYHELKRDLERAGVVVFSSNYTLYGDLSRRVVQTLEPLVPALEIYSIDEVFMDLRGMQGAWNREWALMARERVLRHVGMPTCVGIAPTKALAKVANRVAKKFKERTEGVFVLECPEQIEKALRWLPIGDVWGVGRRLVLRLQEMGVRTAWDFVQLPEEQVRKVMTVVGLRLHKELRGIPCLPLEWVQAPKQSICTSRSFGKMLTELSEVEAAVASFASRCARKLRAQRLCGRSLVVFLSTNFMNPKDPQRSVQAKRVLEVPTNADYELVPLAVQMLRELWMTGYRYKKAGVIVMDNVCETQVQGDLFDCVDRHKSRESMRAMDLVNKRYGSQVLQLASVEQQGDWKLRRQLLSPCYTTRWEDVLVAG
jgi:DNA polymerase V